MPVLANPKHELFAQSLAAGKSARESYVLAGYEPDDGHASRLASNGKVSARVAELLGNAAKKAGITIENLTAMFLEDRSGARDVNQYSAAINALAGIAKLHGLYEDRVRVTGSIEVDDARERLESLVSRVTEAAAVDVAPADGETKH